MTDRQKYALAKLIGAMEGVVSSGLFDGSGAEFEMRQIVAEALAAFDLPAESECEGMPRGVQ